LSPPPCRPSLRDLSDGAAGPNVETLGYFQVSLRDQTQKPASKADWKKAVPSRLARSRSRACSPRPHGVRRHSPYGRSRGRVRWTRTAGPSPRKHSDLVDPGLPHKCGVPMGKGNAAFTRQPLPPAPSLMQPWLRRQAWSYELAKRAKCVFLRYASDLKRIAPGHGKDRAARDSRRSKTDFDRSR